MSSSNNRPTIVWFRTDLRTDDNMALSVASARGGPVVCLYILETPSSDHLALGGAQKWWLHHGLAALRDDLQKRGASLVLRQGDPLTVLRMVVGETDAAGVVWNRRYAPAQITRDTDIKSELRQDGLKAESYDGHLMHEPTQIRTKTGGFYRVYTPFWKAFHAASDSVVRVPVDPPEVIDGVADVASDALDAWGLLPTRPDWASGLRKTWTPGQSGAAERLSDFLDGPVQDYGEARDIPAIDGTSRLSPHLAFGEISPARIWHTATSTGDSSPSRTTFLKELVWREFSYHLLVNTDDLAHANYNRQFDAFPWANNSAYLTAWQTGQTGYPMVDAGMRQLYETGWMHNRVRMIVGSFLVKHLLLHWSHGERWFWDTLVDADPASNTASWQWIAGSGADAAPYFRIFNPITQGEKFDPKGDYVRRFVPELAKIPAKFIHKPWEAPKAILDHAQVTLGKTYPAPIVDHSTARQRALDAYQLMRANVA